MFFFIYISILKKCDKIEIQIEIQIQKSRMLWLFRGCGAYYGIPDVKE